MHGIIHAELKRYVTTNLGAEAWDKLLEASGLGKRAYVPGDSYPDAEIVALVTTASKITGNPVPVILEDFGNFIVPTLVTVYKPFIKPAWKTLDLIEHTESTIHKVVRMKNPGATPPYLKASRPSANEVLVDYTSPRKMCFVAKGIARGLGTHYGETVTISESECMHTGAARCLISVKLIS